MLIERRARKEGKSTGQGLRVEPVQWNVEGFTVCIAEGGQFVGIMLQPCALLVWLVDCAGLTSTSYQ